MILETVRQICLAWPGVTEDVKWDGDLVLSVCGKMFAVVMLDPPHRTSFKVDDEEWAELVERDGVIPAPYLARAKWIALESADVFDTSELRQRLERSYALVRAKLTKTQQAALDAAAARRTPGRKGRRPPRRPTGG